MNNNPFKKNFRFSLGVFFTVLEGILSASVYMALYLLINMLLNSNMTNENIFHLTLLIVAIFLYDLLHMVLVTLKDKLVVVLFQNRFDYI